VSRKAFGRSGAELLLGVALLAALSLPAEPTKTPKPGCTNCVTIEVVLAPDGHVESARILRLAGTDFDRKALAVVKARRYSVPKNNTQKLHLTITVLPHDAP
jgi:TonB family protein